MYRTLANFRRIRGPRAPPGLPGGVHVPVLPPDFPEPWPRLSPTSGADRHDRARDGGSGGPWKTLATLIGCGWRS